MSDPTIRLPAGSGLTRSVNCSDVRVVETGPSGAPFTPVFCTLGGRTAILADPGVDHVADCSEALAAGELPSDDVHAVVEHDPDPERMPIPDRGPLAVGERRILGPCGWEPSTSNPTPIADDLDADDALRAVADAGVGGRGRADGAADDPVSELWRRSRGADGAPVVVVHANDTDNSADRLLCASVAGRVWDAARAVATTVGATDVVAFCGDADADAGAREAMRTAAADESVVAGPSSYLVGEPTMAMEALEGADRIEARRRPPGPEEWGLYGRPTVVHTPRTLLAVRALLVDGGGGESRLVTIRGDVEAEAIVELSAGAPLAAALSAVDGDGRRYVVGGRFGGVGSDLDVPASPSALASAGFGTGGVVELLDADRCIVKTVGERVALAREENCGRCVPCREGTVQLHELLRAISAGEFDADGIDELAGTIAGTSLCDFGVDAMRPVRTAVDRFAAEFRAHARGECPAGVCEVSP